MDHEFWQERWRTNRIAFHQGRVNTMLERHYTRLALVPGDCVFVPMCGKAFDMLWLRQRRQRVLGVELSETAVQAFFTDNELAVTVCPDGRHSRHATEGIALLCGDLFDLSDGQLTGVGAVYDRAALIALPPPMRSRYVRYLASIRPRTASTLLVTLEYPPDQIEGPPFSVVPDEIRALFGSTHAVEHVDTRDALGDDDGLRERGLTELTEHAFLLRPLPR
ncbi:MAG: thiopurine S-methyltransferase [Gammaproteobacteria bacterium]